MLRQRLGDNSNRNLRTLVFSFRAESTSTAKSLEGSFHGPDEHSHARGAGYRNSQLPPKPSRRCYIPDCATAITTFR